MQPGGRHTVTTRHVPVWLLGLVVVVGASVVGSELVAVVDAAPAPRVLSPSTPPDDDASFDGVWTFRGNRSRSFMGEGPVPSDPVVRWRVPAGGAPLCSMSAAGRDPDDLKEWCGTGWTGQPNVVPTDRGLEVREGAYDGAYHFVDVGSGAALLPPLQTGDLAKGSATTDPDGFPLYYAGSRDNRFRIVATDRAEPTVLWELDAISSVPEVLWNDDWDGAALVVDDHLLIGGENGWFYVVRLHRGYDTRGQVTVDPEILATVRGWDPEVLDAVGDEDNSIESSVAYRDGVAYLANSAGLVQGWDVSGVMAGDGEPERVFRYWTGDDTDATVVIDDDGMLYVASEFQRFLDRSREVGQLLKLDPRRPDDPLVWSVAASEVGFDGAGGSWSTPALDGERVYFATAAGRVLAVDRETGEVAWQLQVGSPSIASPVVVDRTLILGDCTGRLSAWDLGAADPGDPPPLRWTVDLGDCIESTPAVWHGWLFLGTREGYVYGLADRDTPAPAP
jgi:outer membrane protein assembly factor BamB